MRHSFSIGDGVTCLKAKNFVYVRKAETLYLLKSKSSFSASKIRAKERLLRLKLLAEKRKLKSGK